MLRANRPSDARSALWSRNRGPPALMGVDVGRVQVMTPFAIGIGLLAIAAASARARLCRCSRRGARPHRHHAARLRARRHDQFRRHHARRHRHRHRPRRSARSTWRMCTGGHAVAPYFIFIRHHAPSGRRASWSGKADGECGRNFSATLRSPWPGGSCWRLPRSLPLVPAKPSSAHPHHHACLCGAGPRPGTSSAASPGRFRSPILCSSAAAPCCRARCWCAYGLNMWLGVVVAAGAAAALGEISGVVQSDYRFRLGHLSFALITMAFAEMAEILRHRHRILRRRVGPVPAEGHR